MTSPRSAEGELLEKFLAECRERVDRCLDAALPPASEPPRELHQAMRYAVFGGGKRLRPALAFATAQALGSHPDRVLPVAAAVELVHAYSLVHDDLPAMDDDEERRGRPTVHVRYGEALAILGGDALLAQAFGCLAAGGAPVDVIRRLAEACGSRALVGGQADDLVFDAASASSESVASIHARKTAALFGAAVWGAARALAAPPPLLEQLDRFAYHYGLAFQIADDLRDGDAGGECSLLAVLPAPQARARGLDHVRAAQAALVPLGAEAGLLRGLAQSIAGQLT